jgi:tetratricopeptide (TPR) repeat protein
MRTTEKYLLIGPLLLLVAVSIVYVVSKEAAKPRNAPAQLFYARKIEERLQNDPKATRQDWLDCIAQYERVFTVWPTSDEVVDAYAHIGTIYKKHLGDLEQARVWYDRVLEEFPDSETAEGIRSERKSIAYAHDESEAGRRDLIASLSEYIEHNPDASELDKLLCDRGQAYLGVKEPDAALADFERILAEFPEGKWADDAVFFIGDAYAQMGREDDALAQYAKVIADYPKSNQVNVAQSRTTKIWERRVGARLDEYFHEHYGVANTKMFFVPPRPLYRIENKDDLTWAEALDKQTLDLVSADLRVEITGAELVVSGTLTIKNPSEVEADGASDDEEEDDEAAEGAEKVEGKKKEEEGPKEATKVWLTLNEAMAIRSLTQGGATLEHKRRGNIVEVTLAEPIAVDGETTLAFTVSNEGKAAAGIVIGEQYGHAFADAFWFPVTVLDDEYCSHISVHVATGLHVLMNRGGLLAAMDGPSPGQFFCDEPVAGRFLVYSSNWSRLGPRGARGVFLVPTTQEAPDAAVGFLDEAVKAFDYLLGVFGTYPYDRIVFAQSPDVKDTMFEHGAGLILVNADVALESITPAQLCNELVQQWYGCFVYPAEDQALWLTAGMASYYETLYLGERYDEATMAAHGAELRALYGEMFEHLPQRSLMGRGPDDSVRVFDALAYTKGAWFMQALRLAAGDEAFFAAQRAFFDKNAFEQVIPKDLRVRFDKAAGEGYYDMFVSWLGAGTPLFTVEDWTVTWSGTQIEVGFRLNQPGPKFVGPFEIAFEAGEPGTPGARRVVEVARITKTVVKKDGETKDGGKDGPSNGPKNGARKSNGPPGKEEVTWHDTFYFTLPFNPERIVLDPNDRTLLDPKCQRIWPRPASADEPAKELILELDGEIGNDPGVMPEGQ